MSSPLLEQVQNLAVGQRIELVEAIWDTIPVDASLGALPLPEEHRVELDRRLDELGTDPDAGSSWAEVRARIERK